MKKEKKDPAKKYELIIPLFYMLAFLMAYRTQHDLLFGFTLGMYTIFVAILMIFYHRTLKELKRLKNARN